MLLAATQIQLTINDGPVTRALAGAVVLLVIGFAVSLIVKADRR